ncbi:MAG: arginase family protein [Gammaproteobacteria bacterium]|nr:arginase family protein [Gammaproteobacteria bacterium]
MDENEGRWAFPWADADEDAEVIFLTVPDDGGSEFEGAAEGPQEMMRWMEELHCVRNEQGGKLDVEKPLEGGPSVTVHDAGDEEYPELEKRAAGWREKGQRIIAVGGDHSNTEALVRGVRPGSLLWLDAHPDFWKAPGRSYAAGLRHLIDDGVVNAANVKMVGLRSVNEPHRQELRDLGMLGQFDGMLDPMYEVVAFLRDAVKPIYVTVDIDACDPAFAPGVSDPVPGGLTSREIIHIVRLCAQSPDLAALDIMEYVPARDEGFRTASLVGWLAVEALSNLPVLN